MNSLRNARGLSLVETLLAVVTLSIVVLGMASFLSKVQASLLKSRVRSQLNTESRVALDTIIPALQRGLATTVDTCECEDTSCRLGCTPSAMTPQQSRIEFNATSAYGVGLSTFTFYWKDRKIYQIEERPGATAPLGPRVLANNVTSLTFGGDGTDPSLVKVSIKLEADADAKTRESVDFPDIMVRMTGK